VDQRQVPFGPEVSWPGGYSQAAANHGEHPYAAYGAAGYGDSGPGYAGQAPESSGYGDPGYSDPAYNGPSSQDAGIAGRRTVRGYIESGYQGAGSHARALPAAAPQDYPAPGPGGQGFGGQDFGEPASYSQPWDYEQPLRYEGEDSGYPGPGHPSGGYPIQGGYAPGAHGTPSYGYPAPAYDPAAYNGSELSRPGIDGPGYDLSGIIGTSDFPAYGYDEPSVERLSYDDPRYTDGAGYGPQGYGAPRGYDPQGYDPQGYDSQGYDPQGYDPQGYGRDDRADARHDAPGGFDETRLDAFFGPDRPARGSSREDRGNGAPGRARPALPPAPTGPRRSAETRLDLGFRALGMSHTRMDMQALRDEQPRFGETRTDMRALAAEPARGRAATGLLARPDERQMDWTDETSLDSFAGMDLDDMPELRQEPSRAVAAALREAPPLRDDTGGQRAIGRRRGRSSDRRQWLALGAVAVVAVGAIAGVLSKFAFGGPSGPAHSISTPNQLGSFTRSPNLEKAMKVSQLRDDVMATSAGQASNVVSALYSMGSTTPGASGPQQAFMFVGGNLANSDPASSLASFEQTYPHATAVSAGALGGEAACTPAVSPQGESVAMCVFFDNDSFGTFMSPSMSTTQLASLMATVRPSVEQVK
jgi:hypothetical protein